MNASVPVSMPDELLELVRQTAQESHLSQQDVIRESIQAGIPKVRERLKTGYERITNVEPLPDEVLERIYSNPARDDEEAIRSFIAAQPKGPE